MDYAVYFMYIYSTSLHIKQTKNNADYAYDIAIFANDILN